MNDHGERNPARHLQEVYSVALGVALVLSAEQVVDLERTGVPFDLALVPTFLTFATAAFTLYHWAGRVLDFSYTGRGKRANPRAALLTEVIVGAIELLFLITLAIVISRPMAFAVGLVALFGFEVLSGWSLRLSGAYAALGRPPRSYLRTNEATFVAAAIAVAVVEAANLDHTGRDVTLGLALLTIVILRTVIVYRSAFTFLFPEHL